MEGANLEVLSLDLVVGKLLLGFWKIKRLAVVRHERHQARVVVPPSTLYGP